jgi:hypothetical protein
MPVGLSSEEEPSSGWINISYPFSTLSNSSGMSNSPLVMNAVSVIGNSLVVRLPIEGWCCPLDHLVDVDSGVSVNSSM